MSTPLGFIRIIHHYWYRFPVCAVVIFSVVCLNVKSVPICWRLFNFCTRGSVYPGYSVVTCKNKFLIDMAKSMNIIKHVNFTALNHFLNIFNKQCFIFCWHGSRRVSQLNYIKRFVWWTQICETSSIVVIVQHFRQLMVHEDNIIVHKNAN